MKKIIGIPGWDIKIGEAFGVTLPYIMWAEQFGKVEILSHKEYKEVDLLLLPGGADVDPKRYGAHFDWFSSKPNMFLENFDKYILPEYIDNGTPIFGICRGMQTLAVHFGGYMNQHMFFHPTSKDSSECDVHGLRTIHNKDAGFKVGSWHHQCVTETGEMQVDLYSSGKNVEECIEAIYHPKLRIHGVQWHPERTYDSYSYEIVKNFLNGK